MKMKLILSYFLFFFLGLQVITAQTNQITVSGKIQFPDFTNENKIILGIRGGDGIVKEFKALDTIKVNQDSTYSLKLKVATAGFYELRVYYMDRITFWADKENLTINFRGLDTARVKVKNPPYIFIKGSDDNNIINQVNMIDYRNYQSMIAVGKDQYAAGQAKDSLWKASTNNKFNDLQIDMQERLKLVVKMYADRPVVLYALKYLNWRKDKDLMMESLDQLIAKYPNFKEAKDQKASILANIAQVKKIADGNKAPALAYPDKDGKILKLSDFKGKYVILDFWASWCGPCRKEIPNLKNTYAKYHDKGLEILSVSIDEKADLWRKALAEEKMTWPQILAQNSKPVMTDYLFGSIPYMVLIDPKGNIVAKNLRGESLEKKLSEIFKL